MTNDSCCPPATAGPQIPLETQFEVAMVEREHSSLSLGDFTLDGGQIPVVMAIPNQRT
jgi:hypothetical protein